MSSAIDVRGLHKSYGDKLVLDGIDLNVAEGTIFALLGPNGAGKTTAVQILSTLITAEIGDIRVAGHDLQDPGVGARRDRRHRSVLRGRRTAHRPGEPIMMADLYHLGAPRATSPGRTSCSSSSTWSRPARRWR